MYSGIFHFFALALYSRFRCSIPEDRRAVRFCFRCVYLSMYMFSGSGFAVIQASLSFACARYTRDEMHVPG